MSDWWQKPRTISVVVDNESWILPYADALRVWCSEQGDEAYMCRAHDKVRHGAAAFYLGCTSITPPNVLALNRRNLVAHASDLPKGRGFSPWTYAVLEGADRIPLCLLEAVDEVDAGPVIYKEWLSLNGTELVDEIREMLGKNILRLCQRFLEEEKPPAGTAQSGTPTVYQRRYPKDSVLDPHKTIAEQFDLLRVVDNQKYPAFFEHRGRRYRLLIEADDTE